MSKFSVNCNMLDSLSAPYFFPHCPITLNFFKEGEPLVVKQKQNEIFRHKNWQILKASRKGTSLNRNTKNLNRYSRKMDKMLE